MFTIQRRSVCVAVYVVGNIRHHFKKQWLISSPRDIPPCRNASVRASGQRLCNGAGLRVVLRRGPWRIRGVVLCVPFGMWLDWSLFAGWRQRAPIPRTVHQRSDNCPVTLSLLHSLCIAGRGNATADDQKKNHSTSPQTQYFRWKVRLDNKERDKWQGDFVRSTNISWTGSSHIHHDQFQISIQTDFARQINDMAIYLWSFALYVTDVNQ